jgi:hypothetical protein
MSEKLLPVGLQYAGVYALDGSFIDPPVDDTFYTGVEIVGPKAFTMNVPQARKITFTGNNIVLGVDYLPATEAMDGELSVSPSDLELIALLSGLSVQDVGSASGLPIATDKQGQEPQVAMIVYQQALSDGIRFWRTLLFPSAKCIYMPAGMGETPEDTKYKVGPTVVKRHLWGTLLTRALHNCTNMQAFEIQSRYKPMIGAWRASGATAVILFDEDYPAVNVESIVVWDSTGAEVTSGITKATTGVTLDNIALYGAGDFYTVMYQFED